MSCYGSLNNKQSCRNMCKTNNANIVIYGVRQKWHSQLYSQPITERPPQSYHRSRQFEQLCQLILVLLRNKVPYSLQAGAAAFSGVCFSCFQVHLHSLGVCGRCFARTVHSWLAPSQGCDSGLTPVLRVSVVRQQPWKRERDVLPEEGRGRGRSCAVSGRLSAEPATPCCCHGGFKRARQGQVNG